MWLRLERVGWSLAAALIVLAASCSRGGGGPAAPPAAEPLPDEQQTLTAATPGDVFVTRDRVNLGIWPDNANICETLVGLDESFKVTPALATKWTLQSPNTFRFELRSGVQFHIGEPLNAEAVAYSLRRAVEKRNVLQTFFGPDSVKVVDERTVDVTATQPNLRLPEQLAHPFFSIIALATEPADKPVCTGPMEFVSYAANDRLVARRFDGYWGTKAKLRELTFRFIPDPNTRRLALESGEVDAIYALPPQQAASVKARPGLRLAPAPPGAVITLSINLHGADPYTVMSDRAVRQALGHALDPKALADDLYAGNVEVVKTVSPTAILGGGAATVKGFSPDLARAEQLLDGAGWKKGSDGIREKEGRKLSVVMVAQFDMERESLQLIQAQARRAGFDVKIDHAPDGAAYARKINSGEFDLDANYFNQNDGNPARIVGLLWYGKTNSPRIGFTNPGPAFDMLVDEALATPDPQTAARKTAEAMQVLIDEEAAAIPLTGFPQIFVLKSSVAGFTAHPSVNHQRWDTVYRTK